MPLPETQIDSELSVGVRDHQVEFAVAVEIAVADSGRKGVASAHFRQLAEHRPAETRRRRDAARNASREAIHACYAARAARAARTSAASASNSTGGPTHAARGASSARATVATQPAVATRATCVARTTNATRASARAVGPGGPGGPGGRVATARRIPARPRGRNCSATTHTGAAHQHPSGARGSGESRYRIGLVTTT